MQSFETSATVGDNGQAQLSGLPFKPGTEIEVSVSPRRRPAEEFAAAWERVSRQLRSAPSVKNITDDEIQDEIKAHRTGQ
jgi:hypothetical protein